MEKSNINKMSLDGAKPVEFKVVTDYAPPDCGGEDEDEYYYVAVCPSCGYKFDNTSRYKYCHECGQKLYWGVTYPRFIDQEE